MARQIEDRTLEILTHTEFDDGVLRINDQLNRKEYLAVNRVLTRLGGRWDRKVKGHVFEQDPTDALDEVMRTGQMPRTRQQEEGFFATPPQLGQCTVENFTEVPNMAEGLVLEPSAGGGRLVEAIKAANPAVEVAAVEPSYARSFEISRSDAAVWTMRFEDWLHTHDRPQRVDAVVMNPPFTLPGRPTAWIEHLWLAWRLVEPGGRVTCIAPRGLAFRDDRKHRAVRALLAQYGGGWKALPEDAFSSSGTDVRAVVAWVDKPADWAPENDPRVRRSRRPSPEERAEYRREDAELRRAADEALEDDEYAASLAERIAKLPPDCRLREYSPRNQALVFNQADALGVRVTGHLATFREWREQGRQIQRGATGLRICAAMGEEDKTEPPEGQEQDEERSPRFRMTARFDLSQTTGADDAG